MEIPVDMTEGAWGEWQLHRSERDDADTPTHTPFTQPRAYSYTRYTLTHTGGVTRPKAQTVITSFNPHTHWSAEYINDITNTEENTMNNARTSDIDRRYIEELDEHEAILERFCHPDTLKPIEALSIDQIVADKRESLGWSNSDHSTGLALKAVRKHIKERVVGNMTGLGRVYLDTDGSHDNPKTYWLRDDIPSIAFGALTEFDVTIQKQCPPALTRLNAIAVYFDPKVAAMRDFKDNRTGEWKRIPNEYHENGYVSIVGAYPDIEAAEDAMSRLQQAVSFLGRSARSATEPDPVSHTGIEDMQPPAGLDAL